MPAIDDAAVTFRLNNFAESGLESESVWLQIGQESMPPVRVSFQNVIELCFWYAVAQAGFDEDLAVNRATSQSPGHLAGQLFAIAGCTLVNRNDCHGRLPPLTSDDVYTRNPPDS